MLWKNPLLKGSNPHEDNESMDHTEASKMAVGYIRVSTERRRDRLRQTPRYEFLEIIHDAAASAATGRFQAAWEP